MAIRQKQYAEELEKQLGRNKILRKAHKRAARQAELRDAKPRPKRKSKIAELIGGKKTYLYRQKEIEAKITKRKPTKFRTTRTKAVEAALRHGGLTEKEVARMRGKK